VRAPQDIVLFHTISRDVDSKMVVRKNVMTRIRDLSDWCVDIGNYYNHEQWSVWEEVISLLRGVCRQVRVTRLNYNCDDPNVQS